MVDALTDLQKMDLADMPVIFRSPYTFILKLADTSVGVTPELAEARKKLSEAEHWIQQHIVRYGSGKSAKQ